MRTRLARWTVAGVSLVGLAVGCSSSHSSTPGTDTASASNFSGIYVTSSEGPIQQFEFVDATHVNVWWAQCAGGEPCQATDTYEVQGSDLVISEPAGNVTTLSLAGLEDGQGTQYDRLHLSGSDPLHLEGMGLGGSDAGGSSLGGGSTLSSGDASVLTQTITIVITFTITIVLTGSSSDAAASPSGSGSSGGTGSGSSSGGSGSGGSASGNGGGGHSLSTCSGVVLSQTFKSANTFPNDKTAFDFFRSKGLSADQAAGVVGNLDQESGDSPTCYQGPNGCSGTPVSGYPGAGIAQWSRGGRWDTNTNDNATAFAKQQGTPLMSEQTQLNFIWYELSNKSYGLSTLEQQTSVTGAAGAFASGFEMCGTCAQTKRNQYAQNAYNAFSGDPVSGGDGGTCTPSYGSCSVSGKSGSCVDTSACSSSGGTSTAGKCPGPSNIQCCTH